MTEPQAKPTKKCQPCKGTGIAIPYANPHWYTPGHVYCKECRGTGRVAK